jgi:uncharacterized protein with von Willebrand factor type A (vWA) domain
MDQLSGVNCRALQRVPLDDLYLIDSPAGAGYLLGHLLRFGRLLRVMGVEVSTRQVLDLVEALEYVRITDRSDFYHTFRALLVNRREDFYVFNQAFHFFWRVAGGEEREDGPADDAELKRLRLPARQAVEEGITEGESEASLPGEGEGEDGPGDPQMVYSPHEVLRQKDFGEMTWEEIQEAKRAMAGLEWRLGERRTRRSRAASKGRLHLRRMVRDNLRHGGEPINLAYRQRVYRPRSLVVLCDISGSMERYSRMLLHFIHALTHGLPQADKEAFVFGTRLTRITRHLRHKDVDESLDELSGVVRDWSGGTRIGEALKTFNFQWVRRVLGRGAVVLVISDGWDRGDLELLSREMARLQRSAYRLIWLNPLLGAEDYAPVQRGMTSALPYVDEFLPVHNLASLEQLAEVLSSVATLRPVRKQHPLRASRAPAEEGEAAAVDKLVGDEYPFLRRHIGLRGIG